MAVVRMQAPKVKGPIYEPGNALTSNLEQVCISLTHIFYVLYISLLHILA